MASHTPVSLLLLPFLFAFAAAADVAQGPAAPPKATNLTGILEKGEQWESSWRAN
jgi:hypothetical protein